MVEGAHDPGRLTCGRHLARSGAHPLHDKRHALPPEKLLLDELVPKDGEGRGRVEVLGDRTDIAGVFAREARPGRRIFHGASFRLHPKTTP